MTSSEGPGGGYVKIDAHAHLAGDKRLAAEAMKRCKIHHVVNINYMMDGAPEHCDGFQTSLDLGAAEFGERFLSCTTFSLDGFGTARFADAAIAALERRFDNKATIGVKIWKSVGMTLVDGEGKRVDCDDERFSPIFAWIEARGAVVYLHIGDPIEAWQPLNEASPHYRYFSRHPEYYFYHRDHAPSHGELMNARDRLVARWPNIRFVAAHLASQSHDLGRVAEFLDAHPNAVVDTSARQQDLMTQDDATVRRFFLGYSDRLLYGTDWSLNRRADEPALPESVRAQVQLHQFGFDYFERRLRLPDDVLHRFYFDNAWRWLRLGERKLNAPSSALPA